MIRPVALINVLWRGLLLRNHVLGSSLGQLSNGWHFGSPLTQIGSQLIQEGAHSSGNDAAVPPLGECADRRLLQQFADIRECGSRSPMACCSWCGPPGVRGEMYAHHFDARQLGVQAVAWRFRISAAAAAGLLSEPVESLGCRTDNHVVRRLDDGQDCPSYGITNSRLYLGIQPILRHPFSDGARTLWLGLLGSEHALPQWRPRFAAGEN